MWGATRTAAQRCEAVSEPSGYAGHPAPGSGPSEKGRHVNSDPANPIGGRPLQGVREGTLC